MLDYNDYTLKDNYYLRKATEEKFFHLQLPHPMKINNQDFDLHH